MITSLARFAHRVVGWATPLVPAPRSLGAGRADDRGLSQSTENAVLLAGAVLVAGIVVAAVRAYVTNNMPG